MLYIRYTHGYICNLPACIFFTRVVIWRRVETDLMLLGAGRAPLVGLARELLRLVGLARSRRLGVPMVERERG